MDAVPNSNGSSADRITNRVFVVGCPRSGTTLLQTMLASHARVFSPPESHFFSKSRVGSWRERLGKRPARKVIEDFLRSIDRQDLFKTVPLWRPSFASYASIFSSIMDQMCIERGKDTWVEKSPPHLRKMNLIESTIRAPKFIHIIRDGQDVVASLHEAALQRPDIWGSAGIKTGIDGCIERWNDDIELSLAKVGKQRHFVCLYDDLIDDPRNILSAVCRFLSLDFDEAMLDFRHTASEVVGWRETYPWARGVFRPLHDTRRQKFSTLFTEAQQRHITSRLRFGGEVGAAIRQSWSFGSDYSLARAG